MNLPVWSHEEKKHDKLQPIEDIKATDLCPSEESDSLTLIVRIDCF